MGEHRYTITDDDRERLRIPRGEVIEGEDVVDAVADHEHVIAVGDRVSLDLAGAGVDLDVAVVDGRIRREAHDEPLDVLDMEITLSAHNPAGAVTDAAWRAVRQACAHTCPVTVQVDGEEDLLALPAILSAPDGAAIVYGHWDVGAVVMRVDDDLRGFACDILDIDRYGHVIVGGSWDRFHAGHRYILLAALERGAHVDVGITSDEMLRSKLGHSDFESFEDRRDSVKTFLDEWGRAANLMRIDDFRGNAVTEGDALVVTDETRGNAEQINRERRDEGREPLALVEVDRITGPDGNVISSTRIRDGTIDENGLER